MHSEESLRPAYASLREIKVTDFPLPIGYEVGQLQDMPTGHPLERCQQLVSTFEFAVRYCAVIALSEYRRLVETYGFRSAELDALIADSIDHPTIKVCTSFIRDIMRHCRHREDRLVVPDLFRFVFDQDGSASRAWSAVDQLRIFSGMMEGGRLEQYETRLVQQFDDNLKHLLEMLSALSWLKNYELIQVFNCSPNGDAFDWDVHVLRGAEIKPEPTKLLAQPFLCQPGRTMVVRNLKTDGKLVLLPFAVFTVHEKRPADQKDFRDDFFYYEQFAHDEMTYVGLRNDERAKNLPHRSLRIALEDYVGELKGLIDTAKGTGREPEDWRALVTRCRSITQDQLQVFYVDKYDPGVYVPRDSVMRHWEPYLQSGQVGFFVVGDSGTGKTNFLCSLADALKDAGEAVLLYNCADIREEAPDVTGILERSMLLQTSVFTRFKQLAAENQSDQPRWLYLLFDAVNEAKAPGRLMDSLVELARELALSGSPGLKVKLVATCRSETWGRLKPNFRGDQYFFQPLGEVAIRLQRFELWELREVYQKYQVRYEVVTPFEELPDNVKNFIRDPLMMRLVCTSFRGRELKRVPKTRQVFENYVKSKIGYVVDSLSHEDREELAFLDRILLKMTELKREELDIKTDLREDAELRQAMLNPTLSSPYWQLRDKGVLTAFGRQDAADRQPCKVKFTYDRVFEYLLQREILGHEPLTSKSAEIVTAQIWASAEFVSLWGAVRIALQMYLDEHEVRDTPLLERLARSTDSRVQAMLIDMLVEYSMTDPQKVRDFVVDILLDMSSDGAGRVAVQTCYEVGLVEGLHAGLMHKSEAVRQLSTQYVFYLWQRAPEQGSQVLERLYADIDRQFRSLVPSAFKNFVGSHRASEIIKGLQQFLNLAVLMVGYAYMGGDRVYRVGRLWAQFAQLISQGLLSVGIRFALSRWGHSFIAEGVNNAAIYNANLLSCVFDYGVGHEYRASIAAMARYLNPKKPIPPELMDRMFNVAQEPIGTPMFFIAMIFYARAKEPERADTWRFCKRLFYEGNVYSKNLALRIAALIAYMEELGGEYIAFVEEMLTELWTGREATYVYPVRGNAGEKPKMTEFPVGYLQFPVIHECRTKTGGSSDFIQKILALPWEGGEAGQTHRILRIIDCLVDGLCIASATQYTNIAPMLGTIAGWASYEDEQVRVRLVDFLRLARSFYPGQVDQFLDGLLDDTSANDPEQGSRVRSLVRSVREGFHLYPLSRLWAGSGIAAVPWLMQKSPQFVGFFGELLVKVGETDTTWDDALREFGSKVGTLEMLQEIAGLLSGEQVNAPVGMVGAAA